MEVFRRIVWGLGPGGQGEVEVEAKVEGNFD